MSAAVICYVADDKYGTDKVDKVFHEMDLHTPLDFSRISPEDFVAIVDFLPDVEDMKKLLEIITPEHAIWFDHHVTTYDIAKREGFDILDGVRTTEFHPAACELVWRHFKGEPVPELIQLVSLDDARLYPPDRKDDILAAHYALLMNKNAPDNPMWSALFDTEDQDGLPSFLDEGYVAYRYDMSRKLMLIENYSHTVNLFGYKFLAVNIAKCKHLVFERVPDVMDVDEYDGWMTYYWNNKIFRFSIYAKDGNSPNMASIAEKFGGRGHVEGAAFHVDETIACKLLRGEAY
jgi:nanoRNase/pAp phosphatase (c-di-AMP/oligoRNAs hydrolase)